MVVTWWASVINTFLINLMGVPGRTRAVLRTARLVVRNVLSRAETSGGYLQESSIFMRGFVNMGVTGAEGTV